MIKYFLFFLLLAGIFLTACNTTIDDPIDLPQNETDHYNESGILDVFGDAGGLEPPILTS